MTLVALRKWISCHNPQLRGHGLAALEAIANEIDCEIEHRYLLLPLDADGVPCAIGDMLDWDGGRHEVMAVDGFCVWFDTDDNDLKLTCCEASGCRHTQRTCSVEDVLDDFQAGRLDKQSAANQILVIVGRDSE